MTNFYTDEQQIIDWLDKYEVKNYTLVPNEQYGFAVNLNGNVNLSNKSLINIPIKFGEVTGSFYSYNNQLTSLEFCPETVGDSFWCSSNKLTSLEFCTQNIGINFDCGDNKLTSLEFCPQTVAGSFNCNSNNLTSLEFCPQTVGGNFYCNGNQELKEIQNITNFKLILLEHKRILTIKFSDKLNNDLVDDNSKKTAKIKI